MVRIELTRAESKSAVLPLDYTPEFTHILYTGKGTLSMIFRKIIWISFSFFPPCFVDKQRAFVVQ